MTGDKIGFGVLGPLLMTVDGAPVPPGTPKQRAVLAVLVMNRNRAVGTDSLITAAWEQWPPSEARASLHSYISNLRRLLGDSRSMLANAPPGYSLTVTDTACDIGRFVLEKTAGVQAAAAGRFEQASDHLTTALAEWRGPVLEDLRDFQFVGAFPTALTEDKVVAHTVMNISPNDPISAATARRRHGAGALLVDIRPQVARHQGSITGALLIDPAAIAEQITDHQREIVVCSVSARRAIPAAEQLSRLGYDRVHYLAGGYAAWHRRTTPR